MLKKLSTSLLLNLLLMYAIAALIIACRLGSIAKSYAFIAVNK